MDLDQLETARDAGLAIDRGMRRFDQRRFAHAPRAPEERVVRRQSASEATRILDQKIAHPIDAAQERNVDAVDARDRCERPPVRAPDEGFGRVEIGLRGSGGRVTLERFGDAAEEVGLAFERRQETIQFD